MQLGLMCVHAHPDDEAIGTGGVLSRYADEGLRTAVVTCTGGELGEIVGPGMNPEEVRPRLGEVRHAELAEALRILGAGDPRLLGFRDSGMTGEPGNLDPESFWSAPFDEAVRRLVRQIRAFRPDVLVTYDAFGLYGHPDHVQTHRVGLVAAEACAMPALYPEDGPAWRVRKVYLATIPKSAIAAVSREFATRGLPSPFGDELDEASIPMGTADAEVTTIVDVRGWLDRKMAALRAHVSQIAPESFFLNVPDDLRDVVFGEEWFVRHRSDVATPDREDDLFAGLRQERQARVDRRSGPRCGQFGAP